MESPKTQARGAPAASSRPPGAGGVARRHWLILLCIVAAGTTLRAVRLSVPKEYVFDEVYYGFTARQYVDGNRSAYDPNAAPPPGVAYEWTHPPLAKLIIAGTMAVCGDGWGAMRLSSVAMAGLATVLVFLATVALFDSAPAGLLASFLYTVEGLSFVHSRLALPEAHFTVFLLAAILFYAKWRRVPGGGLGWLAAAGLAAGLALSVKWTGLYLLAVLGVDFLIALSSRLRPAAPSPAGAARPVLCLSSFDGCHAHTRSGACPVGTGGHGMRGHALPRRRVRAWHPIHHFTCDRALVLLAAAGAACLIVLPAAVYFASYAHYFSMGWAWDDFLELQRQMWGYHTGLTKGHDYQSTPWQWVLNLRPIWLWVHHGPDDLIANTYDLGNSVVFYFGLVAMGLLAVRCAWRRSWPAIFLVAVYLAFWLPWIFSPRIMLFYTYSPAVPMLCIASGALLASWLRNRRRWAKAAAWAVLGLAAAWFVFFLPQMTGLDVPKQGWLQRQYIWWSETPFWCRPHGQ